MSSTDSKDSETPVPAPLVRETKKADTGVPILPALRNRWSPRAFDDQPLPDLTLTALLEAARWAPSSFNDQPWRFIVAKKEDAELFDRVLGCLSPTNREWAPGAAVLMLTVARLRFRRTGKPNRHAFHDVGLAMGNLLAEATALNVAVHQMAGIRPEFAREEFDVPERFEVVSGVALGYVGDPTDLDDRDRRQSEVAERTRLPLTEIAFGGTWGEPSPLIAQSD